MESRGTSPDRWLDSFRSQRSNVLTCCGTYGPENFFYTRGRLTSRKARETIKYYHITTPLLLKPYICVCMYVHLYVCVKDFQEIIKIYDDTSFYISRLIGLNNMPFNHLVIVKKKEETVWAENG